MDCFCIGRYRAKQKIWVSIYYDYGNGVVYHQNSILDFTTKFVLENRNMNFPDAPIFISLSASRLLRFLKFLPKKCGTYNIPAF